ncbi:hypothetical protein T4D_13875 [Trichinella pseudospiralis]|uniref:Uncharacterized protein n=1 Tax=Trichinella pseudospiralis TaxID=6337 RepID=A0A0V1G0D3_TRIPS|nr:hypothetical protein T4D_13875 [Trichinella pseudospiralis]
MACNYARDRKLWRKGVTGDVVCSTPKDDKRTKCVTKAQGLLTVKRKKIIRKRRKLNEVGSLPDEALSAGNSPNLADKNAQDLESPNIFQDQTSTPHKVSVDSSKATVYAESIETDDREHKPDGSVTIKQDEIPQKLRRSNCVRKPLSRLSI